MTDLLILGGTTEARLLCTDVQSLGIDAMVSLAGATSEPANMLLPVRSGGFGGAEGLADWLTGHRVKALIDATHPFAARIPWNASHACNTTGIRRLRLLRPGFHRQPGWIAAKNLATALSHIPSGCRVMVTTGRQDLAALTARPDLNFIVRTIEPVDNLPENATAMRIQAPLDLQQEMDLFAEHRIGTLVVKDSGGVTAPKLQAARDLGIRVILIDRPQQPHGPTVETVHQAVAWLKHVVGFRG